MRFVEGLPSFVETNWILFSAVFIFIGFISMAGILFYRALILFQEHKEYNRRFLVNQNGLEVTRDFDNRILRYISMHLQVIFKLSLPASKIVTILFIIFSLIIGSVTGKILFGVYGRWDANLPYDHVGIGVSFIIGLCVSVVPFILLHAILQQRRAVLSHQMLKYTEEFEKHYLLKRDVYSVFNDMAEGVKHESLRNMTYSLIQALQSNSRWKVEQEIRLFEHQIGTRFAKIFCILLSEALGIIVDDEHKRRESKDIRIGIRSLIDKMHAIERANHEDKPEKREIFQIGLATFPCMYGAYYLTNGIMPKDMARKFLFEVPSQLNFFVLAIVLGFAGICVNILISRRKFNL